MERPSESAISKRSGDLNFASISDIHLGHAQTPSDLITSNLFKAFPDNDETGELDIIFLVGDVFDSALSYSDTHSISLIENWIYSFLKLCSKRDIAVRVLEGTKSHDRGQNAHFQKIIDMAQFKLDYRYITTISIEHNERFNTSFLYIPDFTMPETDSIWMKVREIMNAEGIDSVGYGFVHGAFTYQMPEITAVQMACHRMDRYLSIVDNYIFTGHIHISSVYKRIFCNGSFDRLAHGEEEDKGYWRCKIRQDGNDDLVFQINKNARLYKTLSVVGMDSDEALEYIDKHLPDKSGSACRIEAERGHPVFSNLARIKSTYPTISFTTKKHETKDTQKNILSDLRDDFKEIALTAENLPDLLMKRVVNITDDSAVQARCRAFIEELI